MPRPYVKRTRPDDALTIKVEAPRTVAPESWWINKPREGFSTAAEQEVPRMRESKIPYRLYPQNYE